MSARSRTPRRASRTSAKPTKCCAVPRSAPLTTVWAPAPRPGEDFRPPPDFGAGFEFGGAGRRAPAIRARITAISSSRCSAAPRAGARRHGADRRFEGGEDHHAKVMLDLDASLNGGSRSFTLRVPEIDAEGRLSVRERVSERADPEGHFARADHPPGRPGSRPPDQPGGRRPRRAICISRSNSNRIPRTGSKGAICTWICRYRPGRRRWAPP